MRNRKQSKISVLIATCAALLAGALAFPPASLASKIVAVTQPDGRVVYINANRRAAPSRFTAAPSPARVKSVAVTRSDGRIVYVNVRRRAKFWESADPLSPAPTQIDSIVRRVADRYQIDPKLVHAIIQTESDYDPTAVSSKGAMGLMQLIPATAERFGVADPFDPDQNIEGGVSYLKYLLKLFGGNLPLSLAAYNAGENAVLRSGGVPAIPETEHYVRKVTYLYQSPISGSAKPADSSASNLEPIYRYVDSAGVAHFTNVE
jgi:soluble lytic murein transglycosylase-like protein